MPNKNRIAVNNFVAIDSEYGKIIVNRYCTYQAEYLIKTGRPHIQAELDVILKIILLLGDGAVVVDAGANVGLVTIPIAQAIHSSGGHVLAFEPQRMMSYALSGSAALNDLNNVIVFNKEIGRASCRERVW